MSELGAARAGSRAAGEGSGIVWAVPLVPSCLASLAVTAEGDKFLSHVPELLEGAEPALPFLGYSQTALSME